MELSQTAHPNRRRQTTTLAHPHRRHRRCRTLRLSRGEYLAALRLASPSIATTATSPLSLTLATDAPLPAIATDAPPPSLTLTSDVPSHTLAADAPPLSPRLAAVLVHSRAAATALNGGVALVACAADRRPMPWSTLVRRARSRAAGAADDAPQPLPARRRCKLST